MQLDAVTSHLHFAHAQHFDDRSWCNNVCSCIHMPCNCSKVDVEDTKCTAALIHVLQSHDAKALPGPHQHQKNVCLVGIVSSVTYDDLSCHQYFDTIPCEGPQH